MSDFTPIKVHFDENEYNLKLSDFEGRCEYFQNVIESLKLIKSNIEFESEDLTPLFNDTKKYLVSKFVPEQTKIAGLELSKDRIFDLLDCAKDLENVISKIQSLNTNNANLDNKKNLYSVTKYYFINVSGEVEVKESLKEKLKNDFSVFVKTEKQKEAYQSLEIIVQEIKKLSSIFPRNEIKFIEENLEWSTDGLRGIDMKSLSNLM